LITYTDIPHPHRYAPERLTWSFRHASEQHASLQLNFYCCPICPVQLLSCLFWLSRRWDRWAVACVPSVWPSRLSHLSRHVLDWPDLGHVATHLDEQFLQFSGLGFVTLGALHFTVHSLDLFVFTRVYFVFLEWRLSEAELFSCSCIINSWFL